MTGADTWVLWVRMRRDITEMGSLRLRVGALFSYLTGQLKIIRGQCCGIELRRD